MKKKVLIVVIGSVILFLLLSLGYLKHKDYKRENEDKRYKEIINGFEEAVIWNLDATNLSAKNCEQNISKSVLLTSSYLNSQGYLDLEVMKDIDGKSYCKAYAKSFKTEDCGVDYDIYIKCNNYETEGFADWE